MRKLQDASRRVKSPSPGSYNGPKHIVQSPIHPGRSVISPSEVSAKMAKYFSGRQIHDGCVTAEYQDNMLIEGSHLDRLPIHRLSLHLSQLTWSPISSSRSLHLPARIRPDGQVPSSRSCNRVNIPIPRISPNLPRSFRAPTAPDLIPFPPRQSNTPPPAQGNVGSYEL